MSSLIIKYLGDSPNVKVVDFFIENLFGSYNKTEISEGSGVSRTTLQTLLLELVKEGFLIKRKKGNMDLYSINRKNKFAKFIIKLDYMLNCARLEEECESKTVINSLIFHKRGGCKE